MAKKLKVYRGSSHPHQAQQPVALPDEILGHQKPGRRSARPEAR
jgi:ribosomal protein L13